MSSAQDLLLEAVRLQLATARADLKAARETVDALQVRELGVMAEQRGVKVGDVVVLRGYAHVGKRGRVLRFNYAHDFSVVCRVLKVDGSESFAVTDAHKWEAT